MPRARAEAETLAALGGTLVVTAEDPAPAARRPAARRVRGGCDRGPARAEDGEWAIEAVAGEPVPTRPDEASFSVPIGPLEQLAVVGAALSDEDREVLRAFAAQVQVAVERRRLRADVEAATVLAEGQRAAHRAARRGVARPAHAARVDQGVGDEPAAADVAWTPEHDPRVPRDDRRGDGPAQHAGRQPARHEPAPDRCPAARDAGRRAGGGRAARARRPPGASRPRRARPSRDAAAGQCRCPRCSNVRSPTSSTTRARGRRPISASGSRRARCPTACTCGSSTTDRASRWTSGS